MTRSYSFELMSTNSSGNVSLPPLGVAFLTGMLLASAPSEKTVPRTDRYAPPFGGTFSQLQNAFTGDYAIQPNLDFEGSIATFYASLIARQEPLGAEFEKILYDNLWDLYDD